MESHFPIPSQHQSQLARERIINDVRALVVDGELLLKATADDLSQTALAARERLVATLKRAKDFLAACQRQGIDTVRYAADEAENAIRAHPFAAVAAGAGAGFLAGVLLGARRRHRAAPALD